jgi:hypothetical protein
LVKRTRGEATDLGGLAIRIPTVLDYFTDLEQGQKEYLSQRALTKAQEHERLRLEQVKEQEEAAERRIRDQARLRLPSEKEAEGLPRRPVDFGLIKEWLELKLAELQTAVSNASRAYDSANQKKELAEKSLEFYSKDIDNKGSQATPKDFGWYNHYKDQRREGKKEVQRAATEMKTAIAKQRVCQDILAGGVAEYCRDHFPDHATIGTTRSFSQSFEDYLMQVEQETLREISKSWKKALQDAVIVVGVQLGLASVTGLFIWQYCAWVLSLVGEAPDMPSAYANSILSRINATICVLIYVITGAGLFFIAFRAFKDLRLAAGLTTALLGGVVLTFSIVLAIAWGVEAVVAAEYFRPTSGFLRALIFFPTLGLIFPGVLAATLLWESIVELNEVGYWVPPLGEKNMLFTKHSGEPRSAEELLHEVRKLFRKP